MGSPGTPHARHYPHLYLGYRVTCYPSMHTRALHCVLGTALLPGAGTEPSLASSSGSG